MIDSVEIASLDIDAERFLDLYNSGDLEDFIIDLVKDKTEEERSAYLDQVYADIKTAIDQYKEILSGDEDKLDAAEEADNGLQNKYQRECDELEAFIDSLKDSDIKTELDTIEETANKLFLSTGDTVTVSTSSYADGDNIHLTATGGESYTMADNTVAEALTDLNDDGFTNYLDEQQRINDEYGTRFDENQAVFLKLADDEIIESVEYLDGTYIINISGPSKQTTFELDGLTAGVNFYFDTNNPNFMSDAVKQTLPEDFQKCSYIGDDIYNIYENLHPLSAADKREFIDGYDDVVASSNLTAMAEKYCTTDAATVAGYAKTEMDKLFDFLNDPTTTETSSINEVWTEIIETDLAELDAATRNDVLMCMVMSMSLDQAYFQRFMGGTVPSMIQNAVLSAVPEPGSEFLMMFMMLELQSGGVGMFGGAGFWSLDGYTKQDENGTLLAAGPVFAASGDGVFAINSVWTDVASTTAAFALYQEAVAQTGWAVDDGNAASFTETLQAKEEQDEKDYSTIVTEEYAKALGTAQSYTYAESFVDDADDLGGDGINVDRYIEEVQDGLTAAMGGTVSGSGTGYEYSYTGAAVTVGADIEVIVNNITQYLQSLPEDHNGDVAAGIIWCIEQASPELMKSLCAVEGFANIMLSMINGEGTATVGTNSNVTHKIDNAQDILNGYLSELAEEASAS